MKKYYEGKIEKFSHRHIGPSQKEIKKMLNTLKCSSLNDFIKKTIPKEVLCKKDINIPNHISEHDYINKIENIGKKNKIYKSYIGLGYKNTIMPSVIRRNILENPNWYTPYTPYQSEISQGRLEALINFQTIISDLTGMEISNASMLDESSAASDAMFMIYQEKIKNKEIEENSYFFISKELLPQTISSIKTRCFGLGINFIVDSCKKIFQYKKIFGLIISYPFCTGEIYNYSKITNYSRKKNISVIVSSDILSLSLLSPPGEWGADVVIGSTQSLGIPMGYGGPYAAFFSSKKKFKRFFPGRIIGISVDKKNRKAFRMALQTREQHIKRDKATSNICTSQVLPAIMASMYAIYHGKNGLLRIAKNIHENTVKLDFLISKINCINQINKHYFDTIKIKTNSSIIKKVKDISRIKKTNFRYLDGEHLTITLDETSSKKDINHIFSIFCKAVGIKKNKTIDIKNFNKIPKELRRRSNFLKHKIFQKFHSENELMRYIKNLEKKDLSLTHSMIPLGSCTMKLNAASTLFPITKNKWKDIHPFSPKYQTKGYNFLIDNLKKYLKEITGFSGISLQPNSGSQGEYTGLMVIKNYFYNSSNIKDKNRNIAFIPISSHGTNPASANIAGMKIIPIFTKKNGSIDIDDLLNKSKKYKDNLSVLMVTYPSTYGIYEPRIKEITNIIHKYGGQVYMDGANLNAQVGLIKPSELGIDLCHINLHKTFAIPHGGGGPGMGPICVKSHLIPFLPKNPIEKNLNKNKNTFSISSSPYGSSLILTIPYGYIRMLGKKGLKMCTLISLLNANYIKEKIKNFYNILYVGKNKMVAHELIIDCRPFKSVGIEVIDIAKRMIDYGFHAPTISFPVGGCMMIEPTESESKKEIDLFIEALIKIREEIKEVENGKFSLEENVLKNSPHSIETLTNDNWPYPYSRKKAAYPLEWVKKRKFWTPIDRINEGYGDRNLICKCI